MKVCFAVRKINYLSYFESLIEELVARKMEVVLFMPPYSREEAEGVRILNPQVHQGLVKCIVFKSGRSRWSRVLLNELREILGVRHFLLADGSEGFFTKRWIGYLRFPLNLLFQLRAAQFALESKLAGWLLHQFNANWPVDPWVLAQLKIEKPDIVLASPGNMKCPQEIEFVMAGRSLGIPTVIPVLSWDNLTTKGTFSVHPDQLLVWNDIQKEYALSRHGFQGSEISVVGSCFFDKWFDVVVDSKECSEELVGRGTPSGLEKSNILYLGSSSNIAPDETAIVYELARRLPHEVILVRPHPENAKPFKNFACSNVRIWNDEQIFPNSKLAQRDFYNAIKDAKTVVGVNTSGMIDAVVVGRPTIAILVADYEETQKDALHFSDLIASEVFMVAKSPAEVGDMIESQNLEVDFQNRREKFISRYIRAGQPNTKVAIKFADTIEGFLK